MPTFDRTPDRPEDFGFKISWFAAKATDPAGVLDALQFKEATPANWASGLAAAYWDGPSREFWAFVSPPVSGWVLVASSSLPYPTNETHHDIGRRFDVLFSRLMQRFDDVQFFGSHRVADFVSWAHALDGKPVRVFGFADEVMANFGEQTPEEAKLGFVNLSGLSPSDALDEIFRIAGNRTQSRRRLSQPGYRGVRRERESCKRAVMHFMTKQMWLTWPRFGASTPVGCQNRIIRPIWVWQFACRRGTWPSDDETCSPLPGWSALFLRRRWRGLGVRLGKRSEGQRDREGAEPDGP